MKKFAYVIIWIDSSSFNGWSEIDHPMHSLATITTIGWLVREDKKSVTISSGLSETGKICCSLTIPRSAILKFKKLPKIYASHE